jgi:hypothetical protein
MNGPIKAIADTPAKILEMAAGQYHSDRQAVSQGPLQSILSSPAHFAAVWSEPYSDTGATPLQRQGTIVHCALFEPAEFARYWREQKTGVLSRARVDAINFGRRLIIDLKTTESAGEKEFARHIENFGYHFQAEHYREAAQAVGFDELTLTNSPFDYVFCVAERNPPYGVKFYRLDTRALARAHALRDQAYDILSQCIETNNWPGYEPVIKPVDLPHWAYTSSGESF